MKQTITVTRSRRKSEKLSHEQKQKIVELASNTELTHEQIAKLNDVERSTVTKVLRNYQIDRQSLDIDRRNEADIWLDMSLRHLRAITDEEIKKAPVNIKMTNAAIAYDKYRLASNQSTENISVISRIANDLKKSLNANDND